MVWCMVWYYDILCALKWVFIKYYFDSDVDIGFGRGNGGGRELVVEDEVGSNNRSRVSKYIKGEVDVEIGDSLGWVRVVRDDSKEFGLGVEDEVDS